MGVAGLGEALANGLDALVALVGDVGDLGRGGFEVAAPARLVGDGRFQVSLCGGVVAQQDAFDQLVLGGLDRDDGRGEVLVGGRRGPVHRLVRVVCRRLRGRVPVGQQ